MKSTRLLLNRQTQQRRAAKQRSDQEKRKEKQQSMTKEEWETVQKAEAEREEQRAARKLEKKATQEEAEKSKLDAVRERNEAEQAAAKEEQARALAAAKAVARTVKEDACSSPTARPSQKRRVEKEATRVYPDELLWRNIRVEGVLPPPAQSLLAEIRQEKNTGKIWCVHESEVTTWDQVSVSDELEVAHTRWSNHYDTKWHSTGPVHGPPPLIATLNEDWEASRSAREALAARVRRGEVVPEKRAEQEEQAANAGKHFAFRGSGTFNMVMKLRFDAGGTPLLPPGGMAPLLASSVLANLDSVVFRTTIRHGAPGAEGGTAAALEVANSLRSAAAGVGVPVHGAFFWTDQQRGAPQPPQQWNTLFILREADYTLAEHFASLRDKWGLRPGGPGGDALRHVQTLAAGTVHLCRRVASVLHGVNFDFSPSNVVALDDSLRAIDLDSLWYYEPGPDLADDKVLFFLNLLILSFNARAFARQSSFAQVFADVVAPSLMEIWTEIHAGVLDAGWLRTLGMPLRPPNQGERKDAANRAHQLPPHTGRHAKMQRALLVMADQYLWQPATAAPPPADNIAWPWHWATSEWMRPAAVPQLLRYALHFNCPADAPPAWRATLW